MSPSENRIETLFAQSSKNYGLFLCFRLAGPGGPLSRAQHCPVQGVPGQQGDLQTSITGVWKVLWAREVNLSQRLCGTGVGLGNGKGMAEGTSPEGSAESESGMSLPETGSPSVTFPGRRGQRVV